MAQRNFAWLIQQQYKQQQLNDSRVKNEFEASQEIPTKCKWNEEEIIKNLPKKKRIKRRQKYSRSPRHYSQRGKMPST